MPSLPPAKSATEASGHLPRRILHRAANLLSSNGQPTLAVREEVFGQPTHRRKLSEGNLGASIKKSFKSVKNMPRGLGLTRSNSTSAPPTKTTPPQASGHRRAKSEHLLSRPVFSYSIDSTPPDMDDQTHTLHREHAPPSSNQDSEEQQLATSLDSSSDEVKVPALLLHGTPLLKVSAKKVQTRLFKLDPDQGQILWESKKSGVSA